MSIDHVKVSEAARYKLIALKRKTKIENWNILCRWALCTSLADPTVPPPADIKTDSSIDMTWKIFGGEYDEIYMAQIKERCRRDNLGTNTQTLREQFKLHLHRGIFYLSSNNVYDITTLQSFAFLNN